MAADSKGPGIGFWIFMFLIGSIVAVVKVVRGNFDDLQSAGVRVMLILAFCLWAFLYWIIKEDDWGKFWIGIGQFGSGIWLNWYELSKLVKEGLHEDPTQRLTVIAGGILAIYKGIKDIADGYKDATG